MDNARARQDLMTTVAPRVVDLRAEFEAQLRAVARLEEQLTKTLAGRDRVDRELAEVIRRELAEMANNNKQIRDVLSEIAAAAGAASPI
jgi:hypothetical protein